MGTPIGTPPNAIALKYLNDPEGLNLNIGFGEWMAFMLPYTVVILFIAWFVLLRLFPFKAEKNRVANRRRGEKRLAFHRCICNFRHYGIVVDVR